MNDKLQAIREKCIAANPQGFDEFIGDKRVSFDSGRPIRLADVLLAIGEKTKATHYMVATNGSITERESKEVTSRPFAGRFLATGAGWNLRQDDLTAQSEDTINFLHALLTGVTTN